MRITRPGEARDNPPVPRPPAYDMAREAAIEKTRTPYIHLTCGHLTDWDEDQVYSAWRPHRLSHWCEKCGKWRHRKLKRKRDALPPDPLF